MNAAHIGRMIAETTVGEGDICKGFLDRIHSGAIMGAFAVVAEIEAAIQNSGIW